MNDSIGDMMGQMQKAQEMIKKSREALSKLEVTGESGAGLVKVHKNGNFNMKSIEIDDSLYKEDKKVLQDLIVAADNDANIKVASAKKEKLGDVLSGFNLPPNFNISDILE